MIESLSAPSFDAETNTEEMLSTRVNARSPEERKIVNMMDPDNKACA